MIDAVQLTTRVFREPAADGYRETRDFGPADRLAPLIAPEAFALRLGRLRAELSARLRRETTSSRLLLQLHHIVQRLVGGLEEAPDAARRLADALLVLDQRQAHVIVAVLAEADARRDGDVGLLDQQLRELEDCRDGGSCSGTGVQANIEALGFSIGQPAAAKLSIITSRRRL